MMPTKKNIYGNWIECHMCGDYRLMNKWTCFDKYFMPLLKEIFDTFGRVEGFNTFAFHQLPLKEGDKSNTTLWGINCDGKDCLHQWWCLLCGLEKIISRLWINFWLVLLLPNVTLTILLSLTWIY
jgi:hypothetical protein